MVSNKFQRKFRCVKILEDKREKIRVPSSNVGKREIVEKREREIQIERQMERERVCERENQRICGKILVSVDFSVQFLPRGSHGIILFLKYAKHIYCEEQ